MKLEGSAFDGISFSDSVWILTSRHGEQREEEEVEMNTKQECDCEWVGSDSERYTTLDDSDSHSEWVKCVLLYTFDRWNIE